MYRAIVGDGGDPGLAGDERDRLAGLVAEDDLGVFGGLFPGAEIDITVLEDVSVAGAERRNIFVVIIVGGALFLDNHGDNDLRRELDASTGIFSLAGEDVVGGAGLVGAVVRVCLGVIIENWIKIGDLAEGEDNVTDARRELAGVAGGGDVDFKLGDDLALSAVEGSGFGR